MIWQIVEGTFFSIICGGLFDVCDVPGISDGYFAASSIVV